MPKTGGVSFRTALEAHFGGAFLPDYGDFPLAQAPISRRQQALQWSENVDPDEYRRISCVHGHFLAIKYLRLVDTRKCTVVTWLRDPLARLISHFNYWHRTYDPESESTSPLHRQVVEERWSLRQFCLAPQLKNVYCEFLWGFPVDRLDFVGISEHYADDLRYFSREILGNNLHLHTLNAGEIGTADRQVAELGQSDLKAIAAFHADDFELYWSAKKEHKRRRSRADE